MTAPSASGREPKAARGRCRNHFAASGSVPGWRPVKNMEVPLRCECIGCRDASAFVMESETCPTCHGTGRVAAMGATP